MGIRAASRWSSIYGSDRGCIDELYGIPARICLGERRPYGGFEWSRVSRVQPKDDLRELSQ
jgi:hypothetical protein